MSDDGRTRTAASIDRRTFIGVLGAAGVAGLAGCGGDGGDGDEGGEPTEPSGQGPDDDSEPGGGPGAGDGPGQGGDGPNAGGGNCPAMPSSFTRRDIPAEPGVSSPLATIEMPTEAADVEADASGISAEFDIGTVRAEATLVEGSSVQDAAEDGMEEVTGEFDVPDGAIVQSGSQSITEELLVHIPSGSDVVTVRVNATGPGTCIDALVAIRDRVANSVALT